MPFVELINPASSTENITSAEKVPPQNGRSSETMQDISLDVPIAY